MGIIGPGGLGSLGAQTALAAGARVFVAEVTEAVCACARELGVHGVATVIDSFVVRQLDVIIDFPGFGTTAAAVETVRTRGRVVQVGLAVRGDGRPQRADTEIPGRSLDLVGSQTGT